LLSRLPLISSKIADAVTKGEQAYEKQLQIEGAKEEKEATEKTIPPTQIQVEGVAQESEDEEA
jgi:hypothetical protein